MGFWEVLNSSTDALKRNSPDLTPVTVACKSSYNLGSSAIKTVKDSGAQKLFYYVKDPESREKFGWYLTHPLTREGLKLLPGVAQAAGFAEAMLKHHTSAKSVHSDKKVEYTVEQMKKEMKEMRAENKQLKVELESIKGLHSANVLQTPGIFNSTVAEKPKDVINIFMLRGVKVRDFLDDQVIPIRGKLETGPIKESVPSK